MALFHHNDCPIAWWISKAATANFGSGQIGYRKPGRDGLRKRAAQRISPCTDRYFANDALIAVVPPNTMYLLVHPTLAKPDYNADSDQTTNPYAQVCTLMLEQMYWYQYLATITPFSGTRQPEMDRFKKNHVIKATDRETQPIAPMKLLHPLIR